MMALTSRPHPATYTDKFLPLFAELLRDAANVLDPFAGTGKLAAIKAYGYRGRVVCNDLEPEWSQAFAQPAPGGHCVRTLARANGYAVDEWHYGDAAAMAWALDASFDAIATSPTYGNRTADHHNARDASRRNTYRHSLGRDLSAGSTCVMQWGAAYRHKHTAIYRECLRVLKPGGLFVLNVSDHIRAGRRVYVSKWHLDTLRAMGLTLRACHAVKTPRQRFGANGQARCKVEYIFALEK